MELKMELAESKDREYVLKDYELSHHQQSNAPEQVRGSHTKTETLLASKSQLNIAEAVLESSRRNLLPRSEIPKFGSDITTYHSFIRTFDSNTGNRSMDCEEKLHFLEQFPSGRPRQIVQACLHMEPEERCPFPNGARRERCPFPRPVCRGQEVAEETVW